MAFNFDALQNVLACPQTKAALVLDGQRLVSVDPGSRLSYPIRDDIPIMLVAEATELPLSEWSEIMQKNNRDPATGEAVAV